MNEYIPKRTAAYAKGYLRGVQDGRCLLNADVHAALKECGLSPKSQASTKSVIEYLARELYKKQQELERDKAQIDRLTDQLTHLRSSQVQSPIIIGDDDDEIPPKESLYQMVQRRMRQKDAERDLG